VYRFIGCRKLVDWPFFDDPLRYIAATWSATRCDDEVLGDPVGFGNSIAAYRRQSPPLLPGPPGTPARGDDPIPLPGHGWSRRDAALHMRARVHGRGDSADSSTNTTEPLREARDTHNGSPYACRNSVSEGGLRRV